MALLSDQDLGIVAPAQSDQPAAAPAPVQTAPAPGSEGRTVTVHPRPAPKAPPEPIAPHPSEPLAVPAVAGPDAVGQQPPPKSGLLSDEDLSVQRPEEPSSLLGDVGKSALSGLSTGVTGILGMPHDIPALADYGVDWAAAHINQMTGGENAEEALKRTHGSAIRGAFGDNVADALDKFSPTARLPGAADIQGAVTKAIPMLGYKPQTGAGRYAHEIAAFLPGALIPGGEASLGARALQTVGPAIGSETLGHMAQGTGYEPWARFLGAGLGGLSQSGLTSYTAPLRESGQQDLAATQLRDRTSAPDEALAKIRAAQAQTPPGRAIGENIPGSQPTTAQVTGDLKQVQAERAYQSGEGQAVHAQRMAEQSAAQTRAARGVQPTGNPQSIADLITQRLADIDKKHETDVASALTAHAQKGASLEAQARAETGKVAKLGEPEALGARARGAMAESMAAAKKKEEALWKAIQADKIGVWTTQVAAQARNIAKRVGEMQKPMQGDEARIFGNASGIKRWTKLSDVTDLRSDLTTAMRQERMTNGTTPALKRMTQLLKTVDNVIKNAATRQSAKEAQSTMEGLRRMTPEDQAQIMQARAATRARGDIERGPAGAIIRKGATSDSYRTMPSQVPGKVFAAGPTGYQKLKAYTDAGGKMDPVHDIVADSLAREATTDGMVDAAKLQRWQAKYSDALRALPDEVRQKFIKGPNEAGQALAEGAAARRNELVEHMKRDVAKEMGKESPQAAAMRSHPAFKRFEGAESAKDVQDIVGGILQRPDAVTRMGQLRQHVAGTPAEEGLKRAVLDHVLEKTVGTSEAGTTGEKMLLSGGFQKFVASNRAALKAAGLSDAQLATFDRIAADLQRQQRFNATKVRAGSDTAQNQFASLKKIAEGGHHGSGWLAPLLAGKEIYEHLPEALHGVAGITGAAAIYGGKELLKHFRNKGLIKAKDRYHEAIMDPDVAAALLARRPTPTVTQKLKRSALYGSLAAERHEALSHGRDVYVNRASAAASAPLPQ
jgi:hypothetical protein